MAELGFEDRELDDMELAYAREARGVRSGEASAMRLESTVDMRLLSRAFSFMAA